MFRILDDFLIDRVFQPISDVLARWISCYGIAAFLLTGAILFSFIAAVMHHAWWSIFQGMLGIIWIIPLSLAYRMDAAPPSNALPTERIRFGFWRIIYILIAAANFIVDSLTYVEWYVWISDQAWLLSTLAAYFMACRKLPPKPRYSWAWVREGG